MVFCVIVFFFKQKTAYEMRISDWSSDVCSSDLVVAPAGGGRAAADHGYRRVPEQARVAGHEQRQRRARDAPQQGRVVGVVPAEQVAAGFGPPRSEARRVGIEGGSTCRSRWSQYP